MVEVRLFGELEAVQRDVALPVLGAKQRALLALLALHRGEPVSTDRLIDMLWGDGQAANPANALQAQIGQLRRTLGADSIVTSEAGYALTVSSEDVDVIRFEQLVAKGRRLAEAGEAAQASAALGEALGLRRGEPLAEFAYAGFADAERSRLDELALVAVEARAGADLDLGRHAFGLSAATAPPAPPRMSTCSLMTSTAWKTRPQPFMAPEQITGQAGPPADIFSWAVTVAYAASGQPPFGTGPADAIVYRIVHDSPDITAVPRPACARRLRQRWQRARQAVPPRWISSAG